MADGTIRIRPTLAGDHWINPVLYGEYENIPADKTLKEVVGFDSQEDNLEPNGIARGDVEREVETRLILSSDYNGWNISENFIGEKNLAHEPWEFGYAIGFNRPLDLAASPHDCNFCLENLRAGMEFYGGLGTADNFTVHGTPQYTAPILGWTLPSGTTWLRVTRECEFRGKRCDHVCEATYLPDPGVATGLRTSEPWGAARTY